MVAIRATMKEKTSPNWGIFTSKLGGIPYFPKAISYPVNKEGIPLAFLAQINLSDIFDHPELQIIAEKDPYLKYFPKQGILSFYYDINDLMGLTYPRNYQPDWEKRGYRVLYFPEIITDEADLSRESYDQLPLYKHKKRSKIMALCQLQTVIHYNFQQKKHCFLLIFKYSLIPLKLHYTIILPLWRKREISMNFTMSSTTYLPNIIVVMHSLAILSLHNVILERKQINNIFYSYKSIVLMI